LGRLVTREVVVERACRKWCAGGSCRLWLWRWRLLLLRLRWLGLRLLMGPWQPPCCFSVVIRPAALKLWLRLLCAARLLLLAQLQLHVLLYCLQLPREVEALIHALPMHRGAVLGKVLTALLAALLPCRGAAMQAAALLSMFLYGGAQVQGLAM
jgi:hypothetical protein